MIAEGLLQPMKRRITDEDRERTIRLARTTALGIKGIAERVGLSECTCARILRQAGEAGGRRRKGTVDWWARTSLESLFAVSCETITRWYRNGWLVPTLTKGESEEDGGAKRFTRADLEEFLAVRHAWPAYDPHWLNDPGLREVAERVRATAGGRWMSIAEIAAWATLTPEGVVRRMRSTGWLSAWERITHHNGYRFWVPDGDTLPPYTPLPYHCWKRGADKKGVQHENV